MASGNAIRGSRVGAGPMGEAERGESAPRFRHLLLVRQRPRDQAQLRRGQPRCRRPRRWDCPRCGLPAGQDRENPPHAAAHRALQDAPRLREGAPQRRRRRGDPRRGAGQAARQLTASSSGPAASLSAMPGPLEGVVVVDLSRALAGPHAAMMLGDLGARVIKVENPDGGDDSRGWGPPFVGPDGTTAASRPTSSPATATRSRSPPTSSPTTARTLLTRLVRHADVLVENFRTGVLDRLGFPVERLHELNPRLVVLSISGFGHDGPEGGRAGYDQIAQGEAGPDVADRHRPRRPDAGRRADRRPARRHVRRVRRRRRPARARPHRRGQVVRTSLLAAIVGVHAFQGTRYTVAGEVPYGQGNHHPSICPYGLFHCADGMVQIAVGSESLWRRLAAAFGLPVDDAAASRPTPTGCATATRVIAAVDAAFADAPAGRPAAAAGRARHPGRRGPHPGPGLRLGADPVPGPAGRRRARHWPAGSPCPVRRCGSTATSRVAHTRAADCSASTTQSVRALARRGRRPAR